MSNPTAPGELRAARERLEALDQRTINEIERAAGELSGLVDRQAARTTAAAEGPEPTDLAELRLSRAAALAHCLDATVEALDRHGPDRLALAALDMHASAIEGWIRLLPATIRISGRDAVELAAEWGARTPWSWLARWRDEPRPVALRVLAAAVVARLNSGRERVDGEIAAALADAQRQVSRQWAAARMALDAAIGREVDREDAERAAGRARSEWAAIRDRIDRALEERRFWLGERFLPALAAAIVRGAAGRPPPGIRPRPRGGDWIEHWRQRCESVRAELALDGALQAREAALLEALEEELNRALDEEEALHAELRRVIDLLDRPDGRPEQLKLAVAVTPTATRVAAVARAIDAEAAELPGRLTLAPRLSGRAARVGDGRVVHPSRVFLASCTETVLPASEGLFGAMERDQREIADDLQRACDVVVFASRAAGTGEAAGTVVGEAVANAITLLEFRRDTSRTRQADGMRAGAAVCRACRHARIALRGDWLEQLRQRGRQQIERGLPAASAALVRSVGSAAGAIGGAARSGIRLSLTRIGWLRESSAGAVQVRVRPVLPAEFAGDVASAELPALYRHLFRPDPVEDPRFLVGREAELQAVRDARARWEAGHSAGIVVTGERGSGKTSLINCALLGPLEGLRVERGEFRERVLSSDGLRAAVAGIVGADGGPSLETHLEDGRRVVVIEELERTFLRHIGHYDAVRALGQMINATSSSVLWIVVLNEVAFRFLDAAIGLGHRFSHHIHAGTATAVQIRQAILVRHNLSGLRLKFERPAARSGLGAGLRARLDQRLDPEGAFFEMAARQSGGVYRTAFNIWLGHIAGIRDGLGTIKAPAVTDLAPLIDDLSLTDLFTLVALLQHGSLTPAEHAVVFQQPVETSRAQLDELIAREIVAPDPGRPGYRVRPQAMSVTQEALFRRNLL